MGLIAFVLVLSTLVVVHEFGHFMAARIFGIKVEEFSIGFGKAIVKKKFGDTLFKIGFIPLGGYVRIYGQEEPHKESYSYSQKPVWQRLVVIVAGVFMNFLLAILVSYIVVAQAGFQWVFPYLDGASVPFGKVSVENDVKVSLVYDGLLDGYPAKEAGFPLKGKVCGVGNAAVEDFEELRMLLENSAGLEQSILINTDINGSCNLADDNPNLQGYTIKVTEDGYIGLNMTYEEDPDNHYLLVDYSSYKLTYGFLHTGNMIAFSFEGLAYLVHTAISSHSWEPISQSVSGPVGVYTVVDDTVKKYGVIDLISLTGYLSLNLAIFNLLPFPALDGGYVIFLLFEGITRKKVPQWLEQGSVIIGFIFLILMALLVTYNDIVRMIK